MHTLEQLDLIRQKAPLFSNAVRQSADAARNDAEFISEAEKEIDRLAEQMGVELVRRREYTLAYGRADAVYNRFIIGYEPPGSLRESLQHGGTRHAVQQVKDYILGVSEAEGYKAERVLGVAFDGHYFIYVRYHEGTFHVEPPQMVNGQSAIRFLTTLFSISSERAFIPENLVADFGGQSITARRAIAALSRLGRA